MHLDDDPVVNTTCHLKTYVLHYPKIQRLCSAILSNLHQGGRFLSLQMVGPQKIRQLNRDYRKKDRATDVLSFRQVNWLKNPSLHSSGKPDYRFFRDEKQLKKSDLVKMRAPSRTLLSKISKKDLHLNKNYAGFSGPTTLGDLVICPHIAEKNAVNLQHGLDREFAFLIIHGILHLCGYDHEQAQDEKKMLPIQRKIMDDILKRTSLWQGSIRRVSK